MSANEKQPSIRSTASAPTVSHLYLGSWPFSYSMWDPEVR